MFQLGNNLGYICNFPHVHMGEYCFLKISFCSCLYHCLNMKMNSAWCKTKVFLQNYSVVTCMSGSMDKQMISPYLQDSYKWYKVSPLESIFIEIWNKQMHELFT